MTLEQKLESAKTKLGNVDWITRSTYVTVAGLRKLCDQTEIAYRAMLQTHPYPMPLDLENTLNSTFTSWRSAGDFLTLKGSLDYFSGIPEVVRALELIQPLIDEIHRLEAEIAAEELAANQAAAERLAEIEAAKAAALAEVEARFAEPAPTAPPESPALIRGRQKLASAEV